MAEKEGGAAVCSKCSRARRRVAAVCSRAWRGKQHGAAGEGGGVHSREERGEHEGAAWQREGEKQGAAWCSRAGRREEHQGAAKQ